MKKLIRTAVIVGAVIGGNVYAAGDEDFNSVNTREITIRNTQLQPGKKGVPINSVVASTDYVGPSLPSTVTKDSTLTTQGYVDQQVSGVQNQVNNLGSRINEVERNANAGIAGVAAMSQIQVAPGKDYAVGAGVGTYRGQSSIAIGAAARINENLHFRAGFSSSGVIAAGATYSW